MTRKPKLLLARSIETAPANCKVTVEPPLTNRAPAPEPPDPAADAMPWPLPVAEIPNAVLPLTVVVPPASKRTPSPDPLVLAAPAPPIQYIALPAVPPPVVEAAPPIE